MFKLPAASEFLSSCPKFRLLVLGNTEDTKREIFSKVFSVVLDKISLSEAFSSSHKVEDELDLQGQNNRLAIHTSLNFGDGNEQAYADACKFLEGRKTAEIGQRIHCIWYYVSSDEDRAINDLEVKFFRNLAVVAPDITVVLVFTKYEELVAKVRSKWLNDERKRGMSNVAVAHILRELTAKSFEKQIGRRWDEVVSEGIAPRVCVATDDDGTGRAGFERLTATTLASLRDHHVKQSFAVAQRILPSISTKYCADTAAGYFTVDTGHARKINGVEVADIVAHFFNVTTQVFNLKDSDSLLLDEALPRRVFQAAFESRELALVNDGLKGSQGMGLVNALSPHERACMLAQVLAEILLFFHQLGEAHWPQGDSARGLTQRSIDKEVSELQTGPERKDVHDTIEASTIFTECHLKSQVSDLILKAVEQAQKVHHKSNMVEDESELEEISMSFVNDRSPDNMVLPNGLTILPLN